MPIKDEAAVAVAALAIRAKLDELPGGLDGEPDKASLRLQIDASGDLAALLAHAAYPGDDVPPEWADLAHGLAKALPLLRRQREGAALYVSGLPQELRRRHEDPSFEELLRALHARASARRAGWSVEVPLSLLWRTIEWLERLRGKVRR